jgi:hypothetical protein
MIKMMARLSKILVLIVSISVGLSIFAVAAEKRIVGWIETVSIHPGNMKIKAKLDTGARNSSLNAKHLEQFTRDGETWVRFDLRNYKNRIETFEAEVIRTAKIKQTGQEADRRPVIKLGICIGNTYKEVEVNLEDRSGFNYQMLIGRSFLRGSFIVDPGLTFTIKPNCREGSYE